MQLESSITRFGWTAAMRSGVGSVTWGARVALCFASLSFSWISPGRGALIASVDWVTPWREAKVVQALAVALAGLRPVLVAIAAGIVALLVVLLLVVEEGLATALAPLGLPGKVQLVVVLELLVIAEAALALVALLPAATTLCMEGWLAPKAAATPQAPPARQAARLRFATRPATSCPPTARGFSLFCGIS